MLIVIGCFCMCGCVYGGGLNLFSFQRVFGLVWFGFVLLINHDKFVVGVYCMDGCCGGNPLFGVLITKSRPKSR